MSSDIALEMYSSRTASSKAILWFSKDGSVPNPLLLSACESLEARFPMLQHSLRGLKVGQDCGEDWGCIPERLIAVVV